MGRLNACANSVYQVLLRFFARAGDEASSILDMFPPLSQVVQVNHMFTKKIEELSYSANSAKVRLQLFIQWWVEYSSNYDKLCPWLKGAASRLEQLVVREESIQSPPVSPVELLQDAKVGV